MEGAIITTYEALLFELTELQRERFLKQYQNLLNK